jgi:hypothetical protein
MLFIISPPHFNLTIHKSFGNGESEHSKKSGHYLLAPEKKIEIITAHTTLSGTPENKAPPTPKEPPPDGFKLSWFVHYFDHSKWGITSEFSTDTVVCITGSNREFSQSRRGGEVVCDTKLS